MIRWWDYAVAFLYADFIVVCLFAGFNATVWWQILLFGALAGYLWRSWTDFYCRFRLHLEEEWDAR